MGAIHDIAVAMLAFLGLVVFMVVFHELGHFIAAKACKVRVEAFSVGFGPRLFGVRVGETEYKLCLLPFGGYVKMTGEQPGEEQQLDDPGAFNAHPRWQRMIIGLAGPAANFVLAFGLMTFYYAALNEVPKQDVNMTAVDWVVPNSPAAQAGFRPGDVIVKFDSVVDPDWFQAEGRATLNTNADVPVTVLRNGSALNLRLHIPALRKAEDFDFSKTGLLPRITNQPVSIERVEPDMPAAAGGLEDGDQIVAVDGVNVHYIGTLLAYLDAKNGAPVTLTLLRNGQRVFALVKPTQIGSGWRLGIAVAPVPIRFAPMRIDKAFGRASEFVASNATLIAETMRRLFTHQVGFTQLSGPVGIARVAGEAAESNGWLPKFYVASVISINLGIFNLLPFPILDGGLLAMLLFEAIRRKDISIDVKERIYKFAFTVLAVFFIVVVISDVTKIHYLAHTK